MKSRIYQFPVVAAFALCWTAAAHADITLKQAVEMAVRGKWPSQRTQNVTLNGHGFYIRPVGAATHLTKNGETGYFRHRHRGKDDRVFYKIVVNNRQSYRAEITRIEYRGPFNKGGMIKLGILVVGAATEGPQGVAAAMSIWEAFEQAISDGNIAKITDGKWEREAAKIVDAIGARMAANVP